MTMPVEHAAAILTASLARQLSRPAAEAARLAQRAGGPSLEELERRISALQQRT